MSAHFNYFVVENSSGFVLSRHRTQKNAIAAMRRRLRHGNWNCGDLSIDCVCDDAKKKASARYKLWDFITEPQWTGIVLTESELEGIKQIITAWLIKKKI